MSPLRAVAQALMVLHTMTVHPRGLLPAHAAKAWYLRVKAKKKWREIQEELVNAAGWSTQHREDPLGSALAGPRAEIPGRRSPGRGGPRVPRVPGRRSLDGDPQGVVSRGRGLKC